MLDCPVDEKNTDRQPKNKAVQAFDESPSFLGAIKTLESFEGLLDRPHLAVVVRKCGAILMSDLTLDLRRVRLRLLLARSLHVTLETAKRSALDLLQHQHGCCVDIPGQMIIKGREAICVAPHA